MNKKKKKPTNKKQKNLFSERKRTRLDKNQNKIITTTKLQQLPAVVGLVVKDHQTTMVVHGSTMTGEEQSRLTLPCRTPRNHTSSGEFIPKTDVTHLNVAQESKAHPQQGLGHAHRRTAMTSPWGSRMGNHHDACMKTGICPRGDMEVARSGDRGYQGGRAQGHLLLRLWGRPV